MTDTFRSPDVVAISGLSYRQVDYVIRKFDTLEFNREKDGSGHDRQFTRKGVAQAWLIRQLLDAGFTTMKAVEIMKEMVSRAESSDGYSAGYKNLILDYEARNGLDLELDYYQRKPEDAWLIPWEKASTPAVQGSSRKSTTAGSRS
jgi:hypothetical protein